MSESWAFVPRHKWKLGNIGKAQARKKAQQALGLRNAQYPVRRPDKIPDAALDLGAMSFRERSV